MRFLVTGGCGFLGSNLASEVLRRGHELTVLDSLYREGSEKNLTWLKTLGTFSYKHCDIRAANDVEDIVQNFKPDVVFHCAGQVAMTTSIERPQFDFSTNVIGGMNILEAVRKHRPQAILTYSSTNKVYGDLEDLRYEETASRYVAPDHPQGFDEKLGLDFCSPYGCSKGAVDQYMLDYARIFGLKTVVFRHSSIYGGRQFPTFDQGWVGWFILKAMCQKKKQENSFTISGTGKQVRDLLYVDDILDCYFKTVDNIDTVKGQAYNIGGGAGNSLSVLELVHHLEQLFDVKLKFELLPKRQSDQKIFIANNQKISKKTSWSPQISKEIGLKKMIDWLS